MANKNHPTVWEINNIPAMEYCTIPRAAEILNCKIADIIHFSEIGAIEFCIMLREFEASLLFPFEWTVPNTWESRFSKLHSFVNKSPLSRFRPKANFNPSTEPSEQKIKYSYQHKNSPGLRKPLLFISGLWSLSIMSNQTAFFGKLKANQKVSLTALDFSLKEADEPFITNEGLSNDELMVVCPPTEHLYPNGGLLDQNKVTSIATLTIEDLYITKTQIEKIYHGIGNELPNYINGKIAQPSEFQDIVTSERITAKQSSMIAHLMILNGFSEDELRNMSGESISKKLSEMAARLAIKPLDVDKNTWIDWLKRAGKR
ncbi:hypothetical protein EXT66_19130 [Pectobacterium carotovorum subsp. carotovorum]|uniref:hypothetical protein n=1 Tax=Pectobacterium versatile TaxID=2488639 RepID=UPI00202D9107|nr:hypothetical protein [Pectobacterium carotovorum]MCL6335888.1 hypothetical protein [Pectobacterium carotovorum subsp. carotovorum]MCL6348906.1 hypothetical protein [Pectobacterium carotovorum subsp. carotovorum]MCL6365758.1 hypothetical protein [Pectobacterium carotovorum subsp. carotovorum]MCL6403369.1 hypothetical protein [Pectobacterium carotovorum subsp. carotovorum]